MKDQKSSAQNSMPPATEPLWNINDVARYARCSIRHVTTLREQGLPFRKLGHLVRFSPEAVKRWFED
jgi:phage terminase Nu1 subunit (DNA packaging protein)